MTGAGGTSSSAGSSGASGFLGTAGAMSDPTGGGGSSVVAMTGDAGTSGSAGDSAAAGAGGSSMNAGGATGAAGTGSAGKGTATDGGAGTSAPDAGTAGTGAAGKGAAGAGAAGTGAAGTTPAGQIGCADGTREGYLDRAKYPKIAACSGGWEDPGLTSDDSKTPQCDRHGGNDGDRTDGRGCSVADLCALGWHVCEGSQSVVTLAGNSCADATTVFQAAGNQVFFVTRQHGRMTDCDPDNLTGANNLYGCGTIGTTADKDCAPFTRTLRDSDCQYAFPWDCAQGPIGTSQQELSVVTKRGSTRGGVLCCKD